MVKNLLYFVFQAEDGIRGRTVTGVQTCALPISSDGEEYAAVQGEEPGPIHRKRSGWQPKNSRAKRTEPRGSCKPKCSAQSLRRLPILRTPHSGEHALNSRAYRARSNDGSGERLTTRSHGWRFAEGGLGKRQVHRLSHRPRRRRSPS